MNRMHRLAGLIRKRRVEYVRVKSPSGYLLILSCLQIGLDDFTRNSSEVFVNKRQRRWYNSGATEFRSISGHYLFHIVCLVFPTYVFVSASCCYLLRVLFGDFSFPSFLFSFFSPSHRVKGHHALVINLADN